MKRAIEINQNTSWLEVKFDIIEFLQSQGYFKGKDEDDFVFNTKEGYLILEVGE